MLSVQECVDRGQTRSHEANPSDGKWERCDKENATEAQHAGCEFRDC